MVIGQQSYFQETLALALASLRMFGYDILGLSFDGLINKNYFEEYLEECLRIVFLIESFKDGNFGKRTRGWQEYKNRKSLITQKPSNKEGDMQISCSQTLHYQIRIFSDPAIGFMFFVTKENPSHKQIGRNQFFYFLPHPENLQKS